MAHLRLAAAADTLANRWFPINRATQDVISAKFRRGIYNNDISILVTDLTKDLSLFGYCLQRLFTLARDGKIPKPGAFDIVQLFKTVDTQILREIVEERAENISRHRLEDTTPQQAACLHQMIASSITVETICEKARFPSGAGFASAFFRQLGITLIAWNYPHVLAQAISTVGRGEALDEALLKLLGYSPRALGLAIAHNWGLGAEFGYVLGNKAGLALVKNAGNDRLKSIAEILCKSCEVGEILAQASHPEMYPTSRGAWGEAKKRIEAALGPQGIDLIQKRIGTACETYIQENCKEISKLVKTPLVTTSQAEEVSIKISGGNKGQELSPELRDHLTTLYGKLEGGQSRKDSVLYFAQKVVPAGGFTGGCIYMFDFESAELVLRYHFGTCRLPQPRIPCSALNASNHSVSQAFRSEKPATNYDPWSEEESLGHIAEAFGVIQRVGVLYLEIGKSLSGVSVENVVLNFQVLRRGLQACLGVK